jgi:hypothetical protein
MRGVFEPYAVVVQRLSAAVPLSYTTPPLDLTVGSLLWNTT